MLFGYDKRNQATCCMHSFLPQKDSETILSFRKWYNGMDGESGRFEIIIQSCRGGGGLPEETTDSCYAEPNL